MESEEWDILLFQCVLSCGYAGRGDDTWRGTRLRCGSTRRKVSLAGRSCAGVLVNRGRGISQQG